MQYISALINGKNAAQKAQIKGREIAKIAMAGHYSDLGRGIHIQIIHLEEIVGGVAVFARAWKGKRQLGFGEDGSVDIERFRIFNPPILSEDPLGDVNLDFVSEKTGLLTQRRFRENPVQAIVDTITHTAYLMGRTGTKIAPEKIGNTISTFYPNASSGSAPVDGRCYRDGVAESFLTIRAGAGTGGDATATFGSAILSAAATTNQYNQLRRFIAGFDTSPIPDADPINSAILSFYSDSTQSSNALSQSVTVDRRVPASTTNITSSDFVSSGWAGVEQCAARIALSTWAGVTGYNDFTLNSTGRGNINKTGLSWFGLRLSSDFDNSSPTWSLSVTATAHCWTADQAGNANAPKLTVDHGSATNTSNFFIMF